MRATARVPDSAQLLAAEEVVARHLPITPLVELAGSTGASMLKLETLQPTGSFKIRGRWRRSRQRRPTSRSSPHRPAITRSASRERPSCSAAGRPSSCPRRRQRRRSSRCAASTCGSSAPATATTPPRRTRCSSRPARTRTSFPRTTTPTSSRDSTVAVEIGERLRGPLTIVCPVGGGGLLSGVALWAREHDDVRVVGVEAAASRALSSAVRAGHVVHVPVRPTLATHSGRRRGRLGRDRIAPRRHLVASARRAAHAIRALRSNTPRRRGASAQRAVLAHVVTPPRASSPSCRATSPPPSISPAADGAAVAPPPASDAVLGVLVVEAAAGVPQRALVAVRGDAAGVLQRARGVQQVPCQKRGVAVREVVARPARAGSA